MNFQSLMKSASEMQEKMNNLKKEIAQISASGSSGGDLVLCEINGDGKVTSLTIDDSLMKEDKIMLQDLIIAAINNAKENQAAMVKEKSEEFASSLGLPAGMSLPNF